VRVCIALGDIDAAAEQVDALRRDERPLFRASYQTAAGFLARATGHASVAQQYLLSAVEGWAAVPIVDAVADVLDELALCQSTQSSELLKQTADGLRSGHISVQDAVATAQDLAARSAGTASSPPT
jgi:hypothetical protein